MFQLPPRDPNGRSASRSHIELTYYNLQGETVLLPPPFFYDPVAQMDRAAVH